MKIISFYRGVDEAPHTGCLLSDTALLDFCHPACDLPQPADLLGWFDTESESHKAARAFGEEVQTDESRKDSLRAAGAISTREECCVIAPIPRPGKIICIGLNYADHAEESGMAIPEEPIVFSKYASTIIGPGDEIRVAEGYTLSFGQDDLVINGHAIEVRINAEKVPNFSPCPGKITQYHAPGGLGVRMDSALYQGYSIPPYYDSLIGKLIVHGRDRNEALSRLNRALGELIVDGVDTTIPLFHALLQEDDVLTGDYNIHWLEKWLAKDPFSAA